VKRAGGKLRIEKIDGEFGIGTPFGDALAAAGFAPTPQGLRLRA
jgi:ATP-dependent Lhr-like helicase